MKRFNSRTLGILAALAMSGQAVIAADPPVQAAEKSQTRAMQAEGVGQAKKQMQKQSRKQSRSRQADQGRGKAQGGNSGKGR